MIFIGYTAKSFREWINEYGNLHGLEYSLPNPIYVDHITFANICQELFNWLDKIRYKDGNQEVIFILGPNNGIMFKGIELILDPGKNG